MWLSDSGQSLHTSRCLHWRMGPDGSSAGEKREVVWTLDVDLLLLVTLLIFKVYLLHKWRRVTDSTLSRVSMPWSTPSSSHHGDSGRSPDLKNQQPLRVGLLCHTVLLSEIPSCNLICYSNPLAIKEHLGFSSRKIGHFPSQVFGIVQERPVLDPRVFQLPAFWHWASHLASHYL